MMKGLPARYTQSHLSFAYRQLSTTVFHFKKYKKTLFSLFLSSIYRFLFFFCFLNKNITIKCCNRKTTLIKSDFGHARNNRRNWRGWGGGGEQRRPPLSICLGQLTKPPQETRLSLSLSRASGASGNAKVLTLITHEAHRPPPPPFSPQSELKSSRQGILSLSRYAAAASV